MNEPPPRSIHRRQLIFLGASVALFALLLYIARGVLLPFIMAIFIAYMIEPVVKAFMRTRLGSRHLPRWTAIVFVYIIVLSALGLFSSQFVPRVINEFGKLIPESKQFVHDLKTVHVPEWNRRIQEFIRANFPQASDEAPVDATKSEKPAAQPWSDEWMRAAERARDEAQKQPLAVDPAAAKAREAAVARASEEGAAFVVSPTKDGWAIRFREVAFEVKKVGEGSVLVTPRDADKPLRKAKQKEFDLERAITKGVYDMVENATEHVGDYVVFGQKVVAQVFHAIVGIVITLMIAAFLSIGAVRILAFFRSLMPSGHTVDFEKFMVLLNHGLSGVIRGQILVCLLNGILTAVGLFGVAIVYGEPVKFAAILSILATVMSLIPIFGMIISGAPAVLLALTQSPYLAAFVVVWILLIHFVEANILNPRIIGQHAKIHPVVIIFALLAGEHLYGIPGALLAVPLASMVQTVYLFILGKIYNAPDAPSGERTS